MSSSTEFVITLIGNDTVGKTSIVNRLKYGSYQSHYLYTQGVAEVHIPHFKVGCHAVNLLVFDTGGHHIQKNIIHKFIDAADAIVIVYDITNEKSFMKIPEWLEMSRKRRSRDINENSPIQKNENTDDEERILMLVGNKTDLAEAEHRLTRKAGYHNKEGILLNRRTIKAEQLKDMAHSHGIKIYKEVSAKADINIHVTFQLLVETLLTKRGLSITKPAQKLSTWQKLRNCTIL